MNYIEDTTLKFDINGNIFVKFSNYKPQEKVEQYIMEDTLFNFFFGKN